AAAGRAKMGSSGGNTRTGGGRGLAASFVERLRPLERHPSVGQGRGLGMWLAVDFTADKATKAPFTDDTVKAIARRAHDLGVLVGAIGTAIEIAPVLTSTRDELDRMASVLDQAIGDIEKERNIP